MRAATAEVLASPVIARKSQRIVIAIALIAPVKRRLTSQLDMNSALTRWDAHYVAEQSVPVQALVRYLSGFTALPPPRQEACSAIPVGSFPQRPGFLLVPRRWQRSRKNRRLLRQFCADNRYRSGA